MAAPSAGPSRRVIDAFAAVGELEPLVGGQGTSWRVGETVFKPIDLSVAALRWQADLLARLDGRADFRVSPPRLSRDGSLTVEGWTAWRFEIGETDVKRTNDIIAAGNALHVAVRGEAAPAWLNQRQDRWAIADRVAWDEPPLDASHHIVQALAQARRPVTGRAQLMHGDLTGNVLFTPSLAPLIIDLSAYWRAPQYASAIVVADALVAGRASDELLRPFADDRQFPQYLVRAMIFRCLSAPAGWAADRSTPPHRSPSPPPVRSRKCRGRCVHTTYGFRLDRC